jgi:SAM-dependent methyltransferase
MSISTGRDEAERLATYYSGVAKAYAEFWSPVLRPIGRRLLDALPWDETSRIVDIGTGTGALVADILRLARGARVVGIDRSFGMLALATQPGVSLAAMDAMGLGLRSDAFDVALMVFMLFHTPDPHVALVEVKRVLKPAGCLGVVTWADNPVMPAAKIWDEELEAWGAWDSCPQPPDRDELMNTPEKVATLLSGAGFVPTRTWSERIEYQWAPERFVSLRTQLGAAGRKLESLAPPKRRAFLDRITQQMSRLSADDFLDRRSAICAVASASSKTDSRSP